MDIRSQKVNGKIYAKKLSKPKIQKHRQREERDSDYQSKEYKSTGEDMRKRFLKQRI